MDGCTCNVIPKAEGGLSQAAVVGKYQVKQRSEQRRVVQGKERGSRGGVFIGKPRGQECRRAMDEKDGGGVSASSDR